MVGPGRVGPGRFTTEMGLGVKRNIFSSMDHIPKMLRFEVMQLFQIPLTAAGGSLASSLRFASLAIIINNINIFINEIRLCYDPDFLRYNRL